MYIKFCRGYGVDEKDEAGENLSPESKLPVELAGGEGRPQPLCVCAHRQIPLKHVSGEQGNTRPHRAACLFLTVLGLVLLLLVVLLSVKREYLQPWIM